MSRFKIGLLIINAVFILNATEFNQDFQDLEGKQKLLEQLNPNFQADSVIALSHEILAMGNEQKGFSPLPFYLKLAEAFYIKDNYDSMMFWQGKMQPLISKSSIYYPKYLLLEANQLGFKSRYDVAIGKLLDLIPLFEERNDVGSLSKVYLSIAYNYYQLGDFKNQQEYLLKSVDISIQVADNLGLIEAYNNLGASFRGQGKLDEAKHYYQKAYELLQSIDYPYLLAQNINNRANIAEELKDYAAAEKLFLECLQLSEANNIRFGVLLSFANLGNLTRAQKRFTQSEQYLQSALNLATQLKTKREEALVYQRMARLYRDQADFEKAFIMNEKFYQLNDSLTNESVRKSALEYKEKFEAERRDYEIVSLSKEKLYQQYILALLVAGLFLLLYIIHWLRNKHKISNIKLDLAKELNQTKEQALRQREKDLLQETLEKVAMAEQMNQLIKEIKGGGNQNSIYERLKVIGSKQNPWNNLLAKFKSLHPEFIQKLTSEFPQVNQNDLELCSLVKMNLSTKEIAHILSITDQSVRTRKYRLLKKLGQSKHKDLSHWIHSL